MRKTRRLGTLMVLALAAQLTLALVCPVQAATALEDGSYLMEVTLEGGSGRASVTSPTDVAVHAGVPTATITWSSPHYDYMIVDGTTYQPINTEGNSTFEIPVVAFDEPFSVVADTTAMSVPHEIDYQLTFDAAHAVRVEDEAGTLAAPPLVGACAIALVGAAVLSLWRRQAHAKAKENPPL